MESKKSYNQSNTLDLVPQNSDEIDLVIHYLPQKAEKDVIRNFRVQLYENGDLNLSRLISQLKTMDFPVRNSTIFYYSPSSDMFIYCGKEPLQDCTAVPGHEIKFKDNRKELGIRLRNQDFESAKGDIETEDNLNDVRDDDGEKKKARRHKERKIGDVLDLVLKWRKLYAGVKDPRSGQITKYTLEEAAKKVGVAKKSLDDYLLQIRSAKRFGFNFQENSNERIGILRAFVKKQRGTKKEQGDGTNLGDDFDI